MFLHSEIKFSAEQEKADLKGLYRNVCRLLAHRGGTLGSNRTPNQPLSTPESSARISWPGNFFTWTLIKHNESPKPKHQHTQGIWNHTKLSSSLPLYYNQALRFCVLAITSRNWGKWSQKNGVIVTVKCDLIEEPPCLSSRHMYYEIFIEPGVKDSFVCLA